MRQVILRATHGNTRHVAFAVALSILPKRDTTNMSVQVVDFEQKKEQNIH
jgi:hypothetical protein